MILRVLIVDDEVNIRKTLAVCLESRGHRVTAVSNGQDARAEAAVLLRGLGGTGKTVLARAIHGWSHRAGNPFGVISCPGLSPELLESELFGHVKGAFTVALRNNPGRVAACEGGTLFLDEISDLPLAIQIDMPALSERPEDVVALTKDMLEFFGLRSFD